MGKAKLSVVCPAFEEEACLPFFHAELASVLSRLEDKYEVEIIYVDDGSRDRTLAVVQVLARQDARVRYLSLSRNFGQQAALTAGLEYASGDAVISLDSDLQHPPALIPALVARWREGFDVVLTIREEDRRLGFGKRVTSKLFYWIMGRLSETDVRPARSDYRLLSRKAVDAVLKLGERQRFLRGLVQWIGFSVTEVPFHPDSRKAGQSKYNFRGLLKLASDGIFSFSVRPLRLPYYLGSISLVLGLLVAVIGLGQSLWTGRLAFGLGTSLLIASHLLAGCILLSLGVLGEYVGRIYEQVKQRPLYLLKDRSSEFANADGPGLLPHSSGQRRGAA